MDDPVVIIVVVHVPGRHQLFGVVEAIDALGFALGLGERGQKQGGQDGDDGNHDQQLDQRKSTALAAARGGGIHQLHNPGLDGLVKRGSMSSCGR